MPGPYYCRNCGERLSRCEVYDVERHAEMGHVWVCDDCDMRFVGFGDPGEYNGLPGGAKESNAKDHRAGKPAPVHELVGQADPRETFPDYLKGG